MRQIETHTKSMYVKRELTFKLGDPATVNCLPIAIILPHTAVADPGFPMGGC